MKLKFIDIILLIEILLVILVISVTIDPTITEKHISMIVLGYISGSIYTHIFLINRNK